jgi:hypothetical protein
MDEKKTPAFLQRQKDLILRALTDARFREELEANPQKALGLAKITPEIQKEVKLVLASVKGIHAHIGAIADQLLCANGGGCGIARA